MSATVNRFQEGRPPRPDWYECGGFELPWYWDGKQWTYPRFNFIASCQDRLWCHLASQPDCQDSK